MYFISFCFYGAIFYYQTSPVEDPGSLIVRDKVFEIKEGEGLSEIAERLEYEDLIKSASAFKFYLLIKGKAGRIIPGEYNLSNQLSSRKIGQEITTVRMLEDVTVTIPEGKTLKQINDILVKRGVLKDDSLLEAKIGDIEEWSQLTNLPKEANLEGFLFPDTYHFKSNSSVSEVIEKFSTNFVNKFHSNISEVMDAPDFYEKIIVASLIEAEVPFKSDKFKVADVIYKRMEAGMPIQIDASLIYEKCFIKKVDDDCRVLYKSDLRADSEYNTYTRRGLPIGPIGNPGINALKASFYPEETSYFYYISDPKTKKTIFSETLDQHNLAVRKYLSR